jgi:hypothetical protein
LTGFFVDFVCSAGTGLDLRVNSLPRKPGNQQFFEKICEIPVFFEKLTIHGLDEAGICFG